jgi:hypothetical protein
MRIYSWVFIMILATAGTASAFELGEPCKGDDNKKIACLEAKIKKLNDESSESITNIGHQITRLDKFTRESIEDIRKQITALKK